MFPLAHKKKWGMKTREKREEEKKKKLNIGKERDLGEGSFVNRPRTAHFLW